MKKKLVVAAVAALLAVAASAQGFFEKRYNDWNNGYSGKAVAMYIPKWVDIKAASQHVRQDMISQGFSVREYPKLSKEDNFLLWKALNEYDYKDGECYCVSLTPDGMSIQGVPFYIGLFVTITNNGNSCKIHDMFCATY